MTSILGMNKYQELAIDRHLSVGGIKHNGILANAVLHNGFKTNFQGCYMVAADNSRSRIGVDADLGPYLVGGVSQLMAIQGSDATAVATAGFPDAAAGEKGVLRLTTRDANGVGAVAMWQENALWLAPATNFTVCFDIAQWTQRTLGAAVQFSEIGLVGTAAIADLVAPAKVPGYIDGTNDKASCYVRLFGNQAQLCVVSANLATIQTSANFEIPAGAFTLRIEYNAAASNGSACVSVYVNDRAATSIPTSLVGPLQLFARTCRGASYVAATHTPAIFDVDAVVVSLNA